MIVMAITATAPARSDHCREAGERRQAASHGSAQPLHFLRELEAQLLGFLLRLPIGHAGEHDLPHPGIVLRPRHRLGRPRLVEQRLKTTADLLGIRQILLNRRLQPIGPIAEQPALRRAVRAGAR